MSDGTFGMHLSPQDAVVLADALEAQTAVQVRARRPRFAQAETRLVEGRGVVVTLRNPGAFGQTLVAGEDVGRVTQALRRRFR